MNRRRRILFIGEALSLSHIVRPLVLAQSLNPEQYDIHFACDERYQSLISASTHIHYWPIRTIPSEPAIKAAARGDFIFQKKDIESYVSQEMALFGEILPSLIVTDFRQTVSISAELSHIPYATLTNVYWSPYRIMGFNPVAEFPMRFTIRKRILEKCMPWKQQSDTASFNSIRKKYGLPLVKDYCDLATRGDYTLYADPPGVIETMPMPNHHLFLGPILWEPEIPKPSWWQTWNAALPLIYVTLGTTGAIKWLPEIVRAMRDFPVSIVVATAGRVQLKNQPSNVYITDYLPGIEICGLASAVVCNGGSTTAYQALSQGTPVVGIWGNIDQYLTMMTIQNAGAGLCCSASSLDRKKLQEMILSLLKDPCYRVRAAELSETMRSYNARQRFQQFVHRITERDFHA
jgi:UDP:flavonoid glycosyltransferase YjiC (YdhE family)